MVVGSPSMVSLAIISSAPFLTGERLQARLELKYGRLLAGTSSHLALVGRLLWVPGHNNVPGNDTQ